MSAGISDVTGAIELPAGFEVSRMTEADIEAGKALLKLEEKSMTAVHQDAVFPYNLEDIAYWVVRRKDGVVAKYTVTHEETWKGKNVSGTKAVSTVQKAVVTRSFGDFCNHIPADQPIFETEGIKLFIADAAGIRKAYSRFDYVIDAGQIFSMDGIRNNRVLQGDPELVAALDPLSYDVVMPKFLKIDWDDRKAAPVAPEFWGEAAKLLKGNVCTACQGGHGRSGTSLVCLLMALNPEYGAYDAIVHLRALHCGRAIESKEQHDYIDEVAESLGRPADSHRVSEVKDFKEAFLALTHPSAKPYQDRLRGKK